MCEGALRSGSLGWRRIIVIGYDVLGGVEVWHGMLLNFSSDNDV